MSTPYCAPSSRTWFHLGELALQRRWGSELLWDAARHQRLLWDPIPPELHARIEAAPFFFLATSGPGGRRDCSFKGGGPGLVRVLDGRRVAFPEFDGNDAFMSLGKILHNPQIGCLIIDFADGARLRVNGRAAIHESGERLELFPCCSRAVAVDIEEVVPNCALDVPRRAPAVDAAGSLAARTGALHARRGFSASSSQATSSQRHSRVLQNTSMLCAAIRCVSTWSATATCSMRTSYARSMASSVC